MNNIKLINLRELTMEDQLKLNGGANSEGCTCKCSCNCGPGIHSAGYAGGDAAKNEIKEGGN